ncbi:hypothetical protein GCM10028773_54440 [Spirosoma koreense]
MVNAGTDPFELGMAVEPEDTPATGAEVVCGCTVPVAPADAAPGCTVAAPPGTFKGVVETWAFA